ncbi:MAG: VOC family protein [Gammaproteobacteria bacterium]|nr:VOC family protein [Gammaproteobacteria bacterium]
MELDRLDHLVLTVADIDVTARFYGRVLGMKKVTFKGDRVALEFGQQKINLHQSGCEFEPRAGKVQPGSADLCFIAATPLEQVIEVLSGFGIEIIDGPVKRTGACGSIVSVYIRDPDGNLIEISNYSPE